MAAALAAAAPAAAPAGGLRPGAHSDDREDPEELLRMLAALPPRHPSRPVVRSEAILAWRPLAVSLACRFAGRGEPVPDLVQTATVGLIKAVDRFDLGRGGAFTTFAVPTILGEIKRHFRDHTWLLHVPRRVQELRLAIAESADTLAQELGHPPSTGELAADLRVSEAEVREGLRAARSYVATSLDAPPRDVAGHTGFPLAERMGEEDAGLARAELRMVLAAALAILPARQQYILYLRFFCSLSQDQIAVRLGISQMHVSRLLARSLAELRAHLTGG